MSLRHEVTSHAERGMQGGREGEIHRDRPEVASHAKRERDRKKREGGGEGGREGPRDIRTRPEVAAAPPMQREIHGYFAIRNRAPSGHYSRTVSRALW